MTPISSAVNPACGHPIEHMYICDGHIIGCADCRDEIARGVIAALEPLQPCGHPVSEIATDEDNTEFCRACVWQDFSTEKVLKDKA